MTSVITNLFVSVAVLLKGISLAILDIFAAIWHVIRDVNLAIFHILQGIVGFLYTNIFLIAVLGGGYYAYITYINPQAKNDIAAAARNPSRPVPATTDDQKKAI